MSRFGTGLVLLCCAGLVSAATPPTSTTAPSDLSYCFQLVRAPALGVRVEALLPGSPEGHTDLEVSRSWGGVDTGGDDILDVRVCTARGESLAVEHPEPQRWSVRHLPREQLVVRYRFAPNTYQADPSPSVNRRPILCDSLFHVYGELGLLRPSFLDGGTHRRVNFTWDGFAEAGWRTVCSFGVDAPTQGGLAAGEPSHRVQASLDELRESVFMAGRFELLQRDVHGRPLYVALQGRDWDFEPAAFADLAARIVNLERSFFQDWDYPFFLVTAIAVGKRTPGSMSLGGNGLTNSFDLAMQPGASLEGDFVRNKGIKGLLAHEMFHNWNGRIIGREDPEELVYWFSEGFTDFYARRLLWRGGLITAEEYAGALNKLLADFMSSPARNAANERIKIDFWRDRDVKQLPYWRGDLVAILVDEAMRRKSEGRRSLDDLMFDLVRDARDVGARISTATLLQRIEREVDATTAEAIRRIVVDGATPTLDPVIFSPCLDMRHELVPRFDLGFDFARSRTEGVVRGVDSRSKAAQAGLKDGQKLVGWSFHDDGDTSRPVVMRVREGHGERTISYLPAGESQLLPRFFVHPGADSTSCAGL